MRGSLIFECPNDSLDRGLVLTASAHAHPQHSFTLYKDCYLRGVDLVCHPCPRGSELSRNRSGGTSAASDHPPHDCTTSYHFGRVNFGLLPAGAPN